MILSSTDAMKIQNKAIFLAVLAVGVLSTIAPSAFAQTVIIPSGTAIPGCEEIDDKPNECWDPTEITVEVGATVTWTNDDATAHTVTAGNLQDDPNIVGEKVPNGFDSGMMMGGATFTHPFDVEGSYPYFCMIHPWMIGVVIVQEAMAEEGSLLKIETGVGIANEPLEITVTIGDSDGSTQDVHANFNIIATQGDEVVLDETVHSMSGMEMLTTNALPLDASDEMPVNVNVEFLGFGTNEPFTGTPETGDIQVVPEFGTIAMMVLGVAIVSIIALSAKSRVIPKL